MKKRLTILIIALLVLVGCRADIEMLEDMLYDFEISETAIQDSNISLGDEQEDSEYIFFVYMGDIFSLNSCGDIELILEARNARDLHVWEGYLYYLEFYESEMGHIALVRFNLQYQTKEVLSVGSMSHLTVIDGFIFYVELTFLDEYLLADRIYTLYMRTIGNAESYVVFAGVEGGRFGHHYQYYGGHIYAFIRPSDNIYRISLDNFEKMLVSDRIPWHHFFPPFVIYNGYMHYVVFRESFILYRINLEELKRGYPEIIIDVPVLNNYFFNNGHIYFITAQGIYRANSDGTNAKRIWEEEHAHIIAISNNHTLLRCGNEILQYEIATERMRNIVMPED